MNNSMLLLLYNPNYDSTELQVYRQFIQQVNLTIINNYLRQPGPAFKAMYTI